MMKDLATRLFEGDSANALTNEAARRIETLTKALKDAEAALAEAQDKLWVSHCNHPGDSYIPAEKKGSLWAEHARQDKDMLVKWADAAGVARMNIANALKYD